MHSFLPASRLVAYITCTRYHSYALLVQLLDGIFLVVVDRLCVISIDAGHYFRGRPGRRLE